MEKPCPFCQDGGRIIEGRSYANSVECDTCGVRQPRYHWQSRPREERLEKALREADGLSLAFEKQITETRRYDLSKSRVLDYAKAVRRIARAALDD